MKSLRAYLPESFLTELESCPSDSISPLDGSLGNGNNPAKSKYGVRELRVNTPVLYKGKKGRVDNILDHDMVEVSFKDGEIIKKLRMADVEFDDYADDHDPEESYKHSLENLKKMAGY